MSGTTRAHLRHRRFLDVVGEALDALHAAGDGDEEAARGHLLEVSRLAQRLAGRLDPAKGADAR